MKHKHNTQHGNFQHQILKYLFCTGDALDRRTCFKIQVELLLVLELTSSNYVTNKIHRPRELYFKIYKNFDSKCDSKHLKIPEDK